MVTYKVTVEEFIEIPQAQDHAALPEFSYQILLVNYDNLG